MNKHLLKASSVRSKAAVKKSIELQANKTGNARTNLNDLETTEDERLNQIFLQTYDIATALLPVVPFRRAYDDADLILALYHLL